MSDSACAPVSHPLRPQPATHTQSSNLPHCHYTPPGSSTYDPSHIHQPPTDVPSVSCPSSMIAPSHDECSPATSVSVTTTLEPAGSIETISNRSPSDPKKLPSQLPHIQNNPSILQDNQESSSQIPYPAAPPQSNNQPVLQTRPDPDQPQTSTISSAQPRREMPSLRFNVKDDIFFSLDLPYLANSATPSVPPHSSLSASASSHPSQHDLTNTLSPTGNGDQAIYNSSQSISHSNYQNPGPGIQSATGRSFAHNSEVITLAATRQNSVQLHDYNSNTVLLITLNDSSSTSSTSSHHTIRDGNSTASESVAHDSEADDSDDDHSHVSELTPSEISSDEDNVRNLIKHLQISPVSHIVASALEQCKSLILLPDQHDALMHALDDALKTADSNTNAPPLHPDLRAEVHHALAQHFLTKGYNSRQKSLQHCNCGLLLLHGRERLFPRLAADLHLLAANLLLGRRAHHSMHEIFTHIRAARIALLTCHRMDNVDAHVKLFVTMGFAHSVCTAPPVCEHLLAGFDAYMSAIEMVRLGADSSSTPWMHLTCVAAQLALRFLRHRRHALEDPKSICWLSPTAACRVGVKTKVGPDSSALERNSEDCEITGSRNKCSTSDGMIWSNSRPDMRRVEIDEVLQMVDDVRRKLTAMLDAGSDGEIYDLELRLSVAHECVGRCYVERSYEVHESCGGRQIVNDLRKGCSALQNALRSCEWSDEYAGQRYISLSELLEESHRRLSEAELEEQLRVKSEDDDGGMDEEDEWDDSLWDEIDTRKQSGSGRDSAESEEHVTGSDCISVTALEKGKKNGSESGGEEHEVEKKKIDTSDM